jgi:hypothetical protein
MQFYSNSEEIQTNILRINFNELLGQISTRNDPAEMTIVIDISGSMVELLD